MGRTAWWLVPASVAVAAAVVAALLALGSREPAPPPATATPAAARAPVDLRPGQLHPVEPRCHDGSRAAVPVRTPVSTRIRSRPGSAPTSLHLRVVVTETLRPLLGPAA